MTTIRFTTEDLELFSAASHDRNPLHISKEYARKTPYGEPVVFGILGALAALGCLPDRHDMVLAGVSLEFRNPMTVGVDYRIEESEMSGQQSMVKIYDAERLMMKATFKFVSGQGSQETMDSRYSCPTEAADRKREDFQVGSCVTGIYAPSASDFKKVVARLGLSRKGAAAIQIITMMWASFVVGMQLPGKRAIFWRLALDFQPDDGRLPWGPLSYNMTIKGFDERLDLLHSTGELSFGDRLCATADIRAFVRPDSPQSSITVITALLARSERLKGKVALVIGGSRGLGAAISQALALQGCSVLVNYHHSRGEAEQIRASLGDKSKLIELVQGDAADIQWCEKLREHILREYKGLDFLVCNASPPIRPLSFVPEKLDHFQEFLAKSLALVSVPMSVYLGALSERSGSNVVISSAVASSSLVQDLPLEWPHYVTTKFAIEGLAHWTAAHYEQVHTLVVRPPKLLTDQTNTTMGRQGAMGVEQAAAAIVRNLCNARPSQSVEVLETF